jgi:SAM-dependent methyltransferase
MEASMAEVRRAARSRVPEGITRLFLKQAWTEFKVSRRTRLRFRAGSNDEAVQAYCSMTPAEFMGVNARQRWANWRTLPRLLVGRLPPRPCRAVDLCSGVGDAAEVLAYYLPPGSSILGLEFNPAFVAYAARRLYRGRDRSPVRTSFHCQSVLETFQDADGRFVPDGSVDLVSCCGALSVNFDVRSLDSIAWEAARVLRPGGIATVDSGKSGVDKDQMVEIFARRGFKAYGFAKSCFVDRFTQIGLVKTEGP